MYFACTRPAKPFVCSARLKDHSRSLISARPAQPEAGGRPVCRLGSARPVKSGLPPLACVPLFRANLRRRRPNWNHKQSPARPAAKLTAAGSVQLPTAQTSGAHLAPSATLPRRWPKTPFPARTSSSLGGAGQKMSNHQILASLQCQSKRRSGRKAAANRIEPSRPAPKVSALAWPHTNPARAQNWGSLEPQTGKLASSRASQLFGRAQNGF